MPKKFHWIDKGGYFSTLIFVLVFIAVLYICNAIWNAAAHSFLDPLLAKVVVFALIAFWSTQTHMFPFRLCGNKIVIAKDKFPSWRRKSLPLDEIKNLSFGHGKKWDERGRFSPGFPFIRVTDINGKKYRNVLIDRKGFKLTIEKLVAERIIRKDLDWVSRLIGERKG